jgi:hypothetical protein
MHLLPHDSILARNREVPVIFTNTKGSVIGVKAMDAKKGKLRYVIPAKQIVTLDESQTAEESNRDHWSKSRDNIKYNFKKVRFKDSHGKEHFGIYIPATANNVIDNKDKAFEIKETKVTGLPPEAYTFNVSEGKLDKVVTCSIPVKAGDFIGYGGRYAFEKQIAYSCIHVEVFTPEDVTYFLTNGNKDADTDGEKKYIKVPIGKVLQGPPRTY